MAAAVAAAAGAGSDRKLLLELRKVQDTSWGGEHEKVTLPCRKEMDANVSDQPGARRPRGEASRFLVHPLARLFTR